jgi:hypothetical protein
VLPHPMETRSVDEVTHIALQRADELAQRLRQS